jgi:mRNA interferase HigB
MRVIARRTIKEFWQRHRDAEQPLKAWYAEARSAQWKTPHEVQQEFPTASILKNNRVVFNIMGNKYRLVVAINYQFQIIYIRFVGNHKQYDKINAEKV